MSIVHSSSRAVCRRRSCGSPPGGRIAGSVGAPARRRDTDAVSYRRDRYDPPHGEIDAGLWQVHFALDPEEKNAVKQAAPTVVPAERFEIRTELAEQGEGEITLGLRVYAKTSEGATEEAEHLFRRIRAAAGLSPARGSTLGYQSPWWREKSRASEIGREAHELLTQGRHELAVIRIQTANEMHMREAIERLLRDHHPEAVADRLLRGAVTLTDPQQQALMHMLTGEHVQQTQWWPRYKEHVQRRNAIVHKGLAVNREEATASFEASLELRGWLLDVQGADELDDEDLADDPPSDRGA